MRRIRKRPLNVEVVAKTDKDYALALLRHAVVSSVQNSKKNSISQITLGFRGLMLLQASKMPLPALVISSNQLRKAKLQCDVREVRRECLTGQPFNIFE